MYIKSTLVQNFGNFPLDISRIELRSTSTRKIHLPYTGPLPAELSDATGAAIVIMQRVGLTVDVLLNVKLYGKKHRFPVKATPEEIDSILMPFFFDANGHTKWETGLDRYNMGLLQGNYINWRWFMLEERGLDNLLFQLSPATVESVLQQIGHCEIA